MSSPAVPDAWTTIPYLNDGVTRLVVAWPHGNEYSTFTVNAAKLFHEEPSSRVLITGLADIPRVTELLQRSLLRPSDGGVPVLISEPSSICSGAGDLLQSPTWGDSTRLNLDGKHCSGGYLDHIHLSPAELSHYPRNKQLGPYGGALGESATEFAFVHGKVEVLYVNTDGLMFDAKHPHNIENLPSAILVRAVHFSGTTYTDECLIASGYSVGGLIRR